MKKLTEEDVVRAYTNLVRVCVEHLHNVEREDALSVAQMGLLYAIRTWRAGMDFEEYAKKMIKETVAEYKLNLGRQKRAESMLSLNDMMNPSAENSGTFESVLAVAKMDETEIDVGMFLGTLPGLELRYVQMRMDGFGDDEFSQETGYSLPFIGRMHIRIQGKAAAYFGMVEEDIPRGGADCG